MKITRVECRDGHVYESEEPTGLGGGCHICGQQISYLSIEQVALHESVPGPWMVRVQHINGAARDHLLPAENVANLTLG